MEPDNITKYEQKGIQFAELTRAKDEALKNISEPHFALGKIIAKYCPDFGTQYDKQTHITAVYPVGSQGIFALRTLAEVANAQLAINEVPLRDEEVARVVTDEFLIENATASLNGCHAIVATKDVANLIMEDLRKHNFAPESVGYVEKKGSWSVKFVPDISRFVASRAKIARLMETPQQHPDASSTSTSPPVSTSSSPATTSPPAAPSDRPAVP
jgi:selenophosphate synthase